MINIIWVGLIVISVIFAILNGKVDELNEAIFKGAEEAVVISFSLISILTFWLGMMEIAKKAGLLQKLANIMHPLMIKIFPDLPKGHPVSSYIVSNFVANAFGLGNAATPLGIKTMKEMKKLNGNKPEASRSMVTFLVLNTSGITLVPTTVIAIRLKYGSQSPEEIVAATILASSIACILALIIDRYIYKTKGK
ncbi:MAG TPA: nucleoside recognition domain-containing protein [Massilibacterium sp.]|nr:nucleoside recognition domain-containing protein [Massilibacterium sp.]